MAETEEERVFISVVTIAELRHGIERLSDGARRQRLESWLSEDLPRRFGDRILRVGTDVAHLWGKVVAHSKIIGRLLDAVDAFIAATAQAHGLALVTRNVADFSIFLKSVVNPWGQGAKTSVAGGQA